MYLINLSTSTVEIPSCKYSITSEKSAKISLSLTYLNSPIDNDIIESQNGFCDDITQSQILNISGNSNS